MKKINIKGPVVSNDDAWIYDWLGMEHVSPQSVNNELLEATGDIEVVINSGGGDVFAGSEIYTTLKSYSGEVIVKVVGVACSAASVIAMAGDKVQISPTAQIMIHNVSMVGGGDHNDFDKNSNTLQGFDKSIANAYEIKTGKTTEEILSLMNEETWFNAQSAVENGFADEVMFANEAPKLVASLNTPVFTQDMINKVKSMKESSGDKATISNSNITELVAQEVQKALAEQNKVVDSDNKEKSKACSFFRYTF